MAINIQTREDENNRSIVKPAAQVGKLTLRPLSLGSLELLRQIGNALATGGAALDNLEPHTLTEYIWVHAAPLQDVLEAVYNHPEQVARKVAEFAMDISPADLQGIAAALSGDCAAIQAAGAVPAEDDTEDGSKNVQTPR